MKHPTRHAWHWPAWRLWIPAVVVCALAVTAAPAGAAQPAVQLFEWHEALTLEEAARFLRIEPGELQSLALRDQVPARRIGSQWRFSRSALAAWLAGDWKLIAGTVPPSGGYLASGVDPEATPPAGAAPLTSLAMAGVTGRGERGFAEVEVAQTTGAEEEPEPIGEAPEERTAEEVFLRGQRVLLAPGEVTLDLGLFYSESDDQQLAPVPGGTGLATVENETFTTFLLGRVGVLGETEVFASTSFRDQQSDVVFGSQELSGSSRSEFGDVRLGLRRTLLHEGPGVPDVIVTLDGRIPTGDTSYAMGGGLALVKSIDPAVLFANANYRHTFSRDFADVTRLEPEERIDFTFGYALALNDTLTLSTAVSGLFTSETTFDNFVLRDRDSFSLQFALTSWLAKGLYIEPSVSFGLNGPGNSFAFGVSLPYTFEP